MLVSLEWMVIVLDGSVVCDLLREMWMLYG